MITHSRRPPSDSFGGKRQTWSHRGPKNAGESRAKRVNSSQRRSPLTRTDSRVNAHIQQRPRRDSNPRTRLRRPMLYPLSYEGRRGQGSAHPGPRRTGGAVVIRPGRAPRMRGDHQPRRRPMNRPLHFIAGVVAAAATVTLVCMPTGDPRRTHRHSDRLTNHRRDTRVLRTRLAGQRVRARRVVSLRSIHPVPPRRSGGP
jgi:hypothetical protein